MITQASRALRRPLFAASLLFAVILAFTGAFGTFRMMLPVRLAYWTFVTFSAAACLLAADFLLRRHLKLAGVRSAATVVVAALPTSLLAASAAALVASASMSLRQTLAFYPAALALNLLLVALWRLAETRGVVVEIKPTAKPNDTVPTVLGSKLPPKLSRSSLLAVEAQDHYLKVVTRDGEALIHMRFADALAALKDSDGTRVHRSWWVARTAIDTMKFASGRGRLTLHDGTVVPVSRTFAAHAKDLARRPHA